MPAQQEWFIDQHVARVRFWGIVTVEEVVEMLEISARYVNESTANKVHFLHDWTDIEKFPTNILQIRRESKAIVNEMGKLGWMVVFGMDNRLLRYISQTVLQVFKIRFRMYQREEDAIAYLKLMDISLPELRPARDLPSTVSE